MLIPGIEICQQCHRKAEQSWVLQQPVAPTNCVLCHGYHDPAANLDWDGPMTVRRLLEGDETAKAEPTAGEASSWERYLKILGAIFLPSASRP